MKYKSKVIKIVSAMTESAKINHAMTENEKRWVSLHLGTLKESIQKIAPDQIKPKRVGSKIRSIESALMVGVSKGISFYSTKDPKDITALAANLKLKVSTQVLYTLHPSTMKTQKITKVTII